MQACDDRLSVSPRSHFYWTSPNDINLHLLLSVQRISIRLPGIYNSVFSSNELALTDDDLSEIAVSFFRICYENHLPHHK